MHATSISAFPFLHPHSWTLHTGQETTANLLSFTLVMLVQHPAVLGRLALQQLLQMLKD